MCEYIQVCVCVYIYTCVYMYVYIHVYVYVYAYIYIHECVYMSILQSWVGEGISKPYSTVRNYKTLTDFNS